MYAFKHIRGYILGLSFEFATCIIPAIGTFFFLGEVELVDLLYTAQIHPMAYRVHGFNLSYFARG